MKSISLSFFLFICLNVLASDLNLFDYDPNFQIKKFSKVEEQLTYSVYEVVIRGFHPAFKKKMDVIYTYYKLKGSKPKPTLIQIPPIENVSFRERMVANYFNQNGFNSLIVHQIVNTNDITVPLKDLEPHFIGLITSVRYAIDFLEQRPEVDINNIFVWGGSFGGIIAAMVSKVDYRPKAFAIIVGGSSLPGILVHSSQKIVKKYREYRMKIEGIKNYKSLKKYLKTRLRIDPGMFQGVRPASDYILYTSKWDWRVPTIYQEKLWKNLGYPTRIDTHWTHGGAILYTHTYGIQPFVEFFQQKVQCLKN